MWPHPWSVLLLPAPPNDLLPKLKMPKVAAIHLQKKLRRTCRFENTCTTGMEPMVSRWQGVRWWLLLDWIEIHMTYLRLNVLAFHDAFHHPLVPLVFFHYRLSSRKLMASAKKTVPPSLQLRKIIEISWISTNGFLSCWTAGISFFDVETNSAKSQDAIRDELIRTNGDVASAESLKVSCLKMFFLSFTYFLDFVLCIFAMP